MEFLKNLWKNSPSLFRYLGLTGIVIVYLIVSTRPKTPNFRKMIAEQEKATEIEVVPYKLTPQEVLDKYEFKMRRVCKEQIILKLDTPKPYKVQNIKFTPHITPSPDGLPSAVVDLRVNFIGRKDGNIKGYFSRCAFDSKGQLVKYPNIVSNY